MPYPPITSHRIPYDIDGTEVAIRNDASAHLGITGWVSQPTLAELNNEDFVPVFTHTSIPGIQRTLYFFFPERREIEGVCYSAYDYSNSQNIIIQGSNDTANGMDGTWETATFPNGKPPNNATYQDWFIKNVKPVSFSTSYKTLRVIITTSYGTGVTAHWYGLHLYGTKAYGEQTNDIIFCDAEGNPLTKLTDWGDRPEGTTEFKSFKVKNTSPNKIANNINIQFNHEDFLMSFNPDGPWQATLDISSLPPLGYSSTIYIKNQLKPPPLLLGPKSARIIVSVGSWA